MIRNLQLVRVDSKYCDYLRKYDLRVPYNMHNKSTRPFIGILFEIDNFEYFAPLSSPKLKHKLMKNSIDFLKINNGLLGAINFNNMIPLKKDYYNLININKEYKKESDIKYYKLLKEQLDWLNKNYIQVKKRSHNLYKKYYENKLPLNIMNRCCNFKLLEEKSLLYNN